MLGAVDCVGKPQNGISDAVLNMLADRVHAAAMAPVLLSAPQSPAGTPVAPAEAAPRISAGNHQDPWTGPIILIGASTGGVAAVESVLAGLPPDCPPVVVAQHMPDSFLTSFTSRLDAVLPLKVMSARDGTELRPGTVYLSPGGAAHTGIAQRGNRVFCTRIEGPKVNGHIPSVDHLFGSAVKLADRITAVILTGLGSDGAKAMKALRDAGAHCIGQDEASSVVYGMPRAAAECDALDVQVPLADVARAITRSTSHPKGRSR